MATNSLAMCTNLKRRGMDVETDCLVCHRMDEDGGHLVFKCKYVKQIWRQMGPDNIREKLKDQRSVMNVVEQILMLDRPIQLKVLFLMSNWWNERNRIREGEKRRDASELAALSSRQTEEVRVLHEKPSIPEQACVFRKWKRPTLGFLS